MNAALSGTSRKAIFAAALAFVGKGARVIDDGCPLTPFADNTVSVGVARGRGITREGYRRGAAVSCVLVNVDTLEARAEAS